MLSSFFQRFFRLTSCLANDPAERVASDETSGGSPGGVLPDLLFLSAGFTNNGHLHFRH